MGISSKNAKYSFDVSGTVDFGDLMAEFDRAQKMLNAEHGVQVRFEIHPGDPRDQRESDYVTVVITPKREPQNASVSGRRT